MNNTELVELKLFTNNSLPMLEYLINRWFMLNTDKKVLSADFVEVKEIDEFYAYQVTFKTKFNNVLKPVLGKDIGVTSTLLNLKRTI